MINLMRQLALASEERGQCEMVDPFADAMVLSEAAALRLVQTDTPIRTSPDADGWSAGFWVRSEKDGLPGQYVIIATGCRTEKLARITANYFRLHQAINQINA